MIFHPDRRPARRHRAKTLALLPLATAGAWIAWSHLGRGHVPLPPALPGRRRVLRTRAGAVNFYACDERAGVPLLLIHSVNAAASAYEVRPLYEHYRKSRPVYALDLPGFGFSERSDRAYTPHLMTDAIHAIAQEIRGRHGGAAIDAIALSLPCAYLARAAVERPADYASLGMISPVGFDERLSGDGPAGGDRRRPLAREIASFPLWRRPLFDALVSRPSMRYFLERTWGSQDIDEGLFEYDQLSARQPGAEYAPFSFLSGYLFPTDVSRLYADLRLPVWMLRGSRGDFTDYDRVGEAVSRRNWTVHRLPTGAFPHFEDGNAVFRLYDDFLKRVR
ncbi:alpha/beta fold hydrolase [Methylobacterium gnaphalii]|uniref:AB hydrolase-1 domain-containing protein n=1 Tax=Methylobacterium gnaphalii TaxID=1010610 RepID=A0A512JID7_9HYPH|nr:alpha/beta fold hydrolase [Methylobacterium gnaphalii]GEP09642.1 hypothetical protein MGN01_14870 [Methylobacterium gnaphalii]GJD67770.1 hypothetical protein MMMDOFMJ_0686 [Methylobacterium gnaphalii]GLS50061.1 hypothetical protein GCM10007885_29130 [Methylobacterium gnaphalii]